MSNQLVRKMENHMNRDNTTSPKGHKPALLMMALLLLLSLRSAAAWLLIPMDETQKNHLKAYGIAILTLQKEVEVKWLLNYRGGSFLMQLYPDIQAECVIRGVTFETLGDSRVSGLLSGISSADVNQDAVSMQKAPRIAVYSPPISFPGMMPLPWYSPMPK